MCECNIHTFVIIIRTRLINGPLTEQNVAVVGESDNENSENKGGNQGVLI